MKCKNLMVLNILISNWFSTSDDGFSFAEVLEQIRRRYKLEDGEIVFDKGVEPEAECD